MNGENSVKSSILINASAAKVWQALIDPAIIKQYMFGTTVTTDWKVGSDIIYTGEWQGKTYEDKGKILQVIPEKLLQSTYWSSMGGLEDKPENYVTVTFALTPQDNGTELSIIQTVIGDEAAKKHSGDNWKMVLETIKRLMEQ